MPEKITGIAQLTRQLEALGKLEDGKALRESVRAAMKPAYLRAKQNIPVGIEAHRTYKGRLVAPGFAQRSIKIVTTLSKDKQKASAILGVSAEAFYAVLFVEMGTSKMAAQPWIRPAFYGTKEEQLEGLSGGLLKAITKASKTK